MRTVQPEMPVAEITRLVAEHPSNRSEDGTPFFDAPLVGFASANDPIFTDYKEVIGSFHWTPAQAFEAAHGEGSFTAGTVICWALPIVKETRKANRAEKRFPAKRWTHTRYFGEKFNFQLRQAIVEWLENQGHPSVAPHNLPQWERLDDVRVDLASTWSERHAAFVAGLGTFSLNDGFITERGIAHRLGSVVTSLVLPPSPRPYAHRRANCLFYAGDAPGTDCGACISRCPVGAITEAGHYKKACGHYSYCTVRETVAAEHGVEITGCGLCQTGVPCESRNPAKTRK